jgi:hypothetical protein
LALITVERFHKASLRTGSIHFHGMLPEHPSVDDNQIFRWWQ